MKTFTHSPLLLSVLLAATLLYGCRDTCETTTAYTYYEPVYTSLETLRSSVSFGEDRPIDEAGKIYLINDHLLVNEPNEGIHIINNKDPENPENLGFINIPGNFDMAAVDGYLFVDSYVDLVILDITDFTNPKEVKRVKNVFPEYNSYGYYASEEGIVTGWAEVEQTHEVNTDCESSGQVYYPWGYRYDKGIAVDAVFASESLGGAATPGIGGSMARFTINNSHLYMIDQSVMHIVDITTPTEPVLGTRVDVGWGIETIFPYDSLLFIGANNGMYIYDVSSPLSPNQLSNYSHMTSCDPVVTDGRYAYVTLRSGNQCAGFTNQLEVIDIADPSDPELIETYPMYNPHGLSISDNRLFICDGEAGLKIYNAHDVHSIGDQLIKNYGDIHAYDVIVNECLVMLIGDDGLHQYHCNDFDDIIYLSTIPF